MTKITTSLPAEANPTADKAILNDDKLSSISSLFLSDKDNNSQGFDQAQKRSSNHHSFLNPEKADGKVREKITEDDIDDLDNISSPGKPRKKPKSINSPNSFKNSLD